jgi:phage tail sheath protein FI
MPETFLHGVEVVEITDGPRPIRTVRSSVIGLVGTAIGTPTGFPINTPVLVTSASAATTLGASSYLGKALDAIFKQAGALVVVVRVATANDVAGSVSSLTGVHALRSAQSTLGYTPRVIVAEGADAVTTIDDVKSVAASLRAVAIVGLNSGGASLDTATEATAWVTANGNDRTYALWPFVNAGQDPAPFVAGLIAKSDNDRGFWWSPSNQEVFGIESLDKPVDFQLGDNTSLANVLNEGKVTTFIREGGFRLWGNRTGSSDAKYAFLSVRRTADLIFDSILRAHLWAVDRNITKTYLSDVSESVNAYLRTLQNLGAVIGGTCWPDPDLNSPANIASGNVYFNFDFTPPYPAEHVTFRAILTQDYLAELITQ